MSAPNFDLREYPCPTCGGAGTVFVRHPRYGTSSCPYEGDDEECPDCIDGTVELDRHAAHDQGLDPGVPIGADDPLELMRAARKRRGLAYRLARHRAMERVPLGAAA